jgi:FdhD protein
MPRLSAAQAPLLREVVIVDERGQRRPLAIPAERPLTVYVDKQELVTLMTLGAAPELLVLGWLINQRLVGDPRDIAAIDVDWDVAAAAVKTHAGIADLARRTARRVVTTGCGQGTVFGEMLDEIAAAARPDARQEPIAQATLQRVLETMRRRDSVHRRAGSVHGCALFDAGDAARLVVATEDVGRHNAIDAIAGWMALHGVAGSGKLFYTTGRLTSEMVLKAVRMGLSVVVSRNGVTAMGHELAQQLGVALFGRAANGRFLCYTGHERLVFQES